MVKGKGKGNNSNSGVMLFSVVYAAEWWFLAGEPSSAALTVAGLLLLFAFVGYCLMAIMLPPPSASRKAETFVPLPPEEGNGPKALTFS